MKRLIGTVILFFAYFLLASANEESASEPLIAAPTVELKRIQKPSSDLLASSSIARSYRHHDFDNIQEQSLSRSDAAAPSSNGIFTETKKPAVKKSRQPSSKPSGYGYPYRMAPTLPPYERHVTDRYDDESEIKSAIFPTAILPSEPKLPPMPRMPSIPKISAGDDVLSKREDSLKKRQGLPFDDVSSSSREISFDYNSYKEPSYRNFHDLEFSPRRMYYESGGPMSRPSYSFPSPKPSPPVSPRDPYLSPSSEPIDGFYPKVKNNGVSSYSSYGKRDKYYKTIADSIPPDSRGYGGSDEFRDTSSEEDDFRPGVRGYGESHEYQEAPPPYSDPYSEPSPKEPVRTSEEGSYDSLYNSPITGMTRKRLLTYAGASDLYEGEPDYLKSAALRKTKFGSIQDDYYPYPRSRSYNYDDHSFEESRKVSTRTKRQVTQNEETAPRCSKNSTLPLCLRDDDYPTAEVRKIVSKNMKFLSQMRNTRLEISEKKSTNNDPESLDDLKETKSVCSSKKGYIYPKRAVDADGIWRTVINVNGVKQSIEVDVCKSSENPCDHVPVAIPTKCVQKYSFVTLITLNMEENIMEHHDFPVPSSCACSVGRPTRIPVE